MTLFDPVLIDVKTIKNRILVPPFSGNQAERSGKVSQILFENLLRIAKQGAGTIIIDSAYVCQQGRGTQNQLGLSEENHLPSLKNMISILKENGIFIGIRLSHAGGKTSAKICGETPISPSEYNFGKEYNDCREFDEYDVKEVCTFFAHAAERAEEADVDFIEINASQDLLLSQCINPNINTRNDMFGGNLKNRMYFATQVIQDIKKRISKDILLSFFFSNPLDYLDQEHGMQELLGIIKILEDEKVDFLHPDFSNVLSKFLEGSESVLEIVARNSSTPLIVEGNIKSTLILKNILKLNTGALYCLDKSLFLRQNWYQYLQKKIAM